MNSTCIVGYSDAAFANNHDLITAEQDNPTYWWHWEGNPYCFQEIWVSQDNKIGSVSRNSSNRRFFRRRSRDSVSIGTIKSWTCSWSLANRFKVSVRYNQERITHERKKDHAWRTRSTWSIQKKEISNIGFVRSSENLADGLTKGNVQKALLNFLQTGEHKINCEQWILK